MFAAVMLFASLGLDTLAVAVGLGLSGLPRAKWLRVGLVFAFFEGVMPIIGLVAGKHLSGFGEWAGYGAAILLILVGGHEIKQHFSDKDDDDEPLSVEGGKLLLTGLSVGLDELAVGFSLGVLHVPVGPALGYIALQAFALTFVGLSWGTRIGKQFGEAAELIAGVVLILLGIGLFVGQIMGSHSLN